MITVYSKPDCGACEATKLWLKNKKLSFSEIDVTKDEQAFQKISGLGYKEMPVVETKDHGIWSGFRIDKLKVLVPIQAK